MPKFEVIATHTKTYLHSVEASNLEEAVRMVKDNEHEGNLIDEGEKKIDNAKEVEAFSFE